VALGFAIGAALTFGPPLARTAWRSFEHSAPVASQQSRDPADRLTNLGGNRRLLWTVSLDVFADHPVGGIGAGTFQFAWDRSPRRDGHVLDAHSVVIESLAEMGLPGALLVVVLFGALLAAAVRAPARAGEGPARGAAAGCAAAFVVFTISACVDWMWESTAVACAGLIVGTLAAAGGGALGRRPRRRLRAAVGLAAAAVLLVQLPVLVAADHLRTSQADAGRGDFVDALRQANAAAEAEPWAASAFLQRGLVLEQVGQLSAAAAAVQHATRLEPENWQHWLTLGRIEAERARIGPALAAVARARRLSPRAPIFQPGVAEHFARHRRPGP
jgi:O-antigen ligase